MPAPFYNAIKGTTAGAPGTGAFTPNAASAGFLAWSVVPSGWMGLVRFEDGSAWSLEYCYWNATTLSRASTQVAQNSAGLMTSTGSHLTLTSAATAAMVVDAGDIMSHLGSTPWRGWFTLVGNATPANVGLTAPTATGTAASASMAGTNYLTEQPRTQLTSATTANAQAGWSSTTAQVAVSTTAGRGGFEFITRFGPSQIPTGPRLFAGMTAVTFVANAGEPSAFTANYAVFAKDSGDTNIQMLVNSNASTGTKMDTGIALAANGWYEASIWMEPGSNTIYGLLMRLDNGAIWHGKTSTDVPSAGSFLFPQVLAGLSSTTGTAMILHMASVHLRSAS